MATETAIDKKEEAVTQPERIRGGLTFRPHVDIIEQTEQLLIVADVPGAKAENVDLQYENGELTINVAVQNRMPDEGNELLLREYGIGDYYRSFRIGEGIDAAKIEATVREGVLTVHLPKADTAMPRRISVQSR